MTRLHGLRRSFPTLGAPARWIMRSRRRICVASLMLLAMAVGPLLWWRMQLLGLPDIGDPFDVTAFRTFTIPDDRNAYVLYRQAAAQLKPWYLHSNTAGNRLNMSATWSKANPELRQWVEENREALSVYRRGSERPDALGEVPRFYGYHQDQWGMEGTLDSFITLALLEGSRLQERGDTAGAWGWYGAILRTIHHVGMHGTVFRRGVAQGWHNQLRGRLTTWTADPRTTPTMLRAALDEVVACESLAPSETYLLKAEYLDVDRLLDDPEGPALLTPGSWLHPIPSLDFRLTQEQAEAFYSTWRSWRREPERSRRAMRLAIANWLAYYEMPPADRPRADYHGWLFYVFYPFGPEAPANARALSPRSLSSWLRSSVDANFLFGSWGWTGVQMSEQANHRALLILLATELYRRDHGTDPPTPESLIGPYLKSLPAQVDDGTDQVIPRAGKPVEETPAESVDPKSRTEREDWR